LIDPYLGFYIDPNIDQYKRRVKNYWYFWFYVNAYYSPALFRRRDCVTITIFVIPCKQSATRNPVF